MKSKHETMKGKHCRRAMPSITALLALSILGPWLLAMVCLTLVTAQELYDKLYDASRDFPAAVSQQGGLDDFFDPAAPRYSAQHTQPDLLEYQMLNAIARSGSQNLDSGGAYGSSPVTRPKLLRDLSYPMETAVLFYDGEGTLYHSSGEDLLFFPYYTQAEWDAGADETGAGRFSWIDISREKDAPAHEDDPYLLLRNIQQGTGSLLSDIDALRITGYFEDTELKPLEIQYVTKTRVIQTLDSTGQLSTGQNNASYLLSDLDRRGLLEWDTLPLPGGDGQGREVVTVYAVNPQMWIPRNSPQTYYGSSYGSLTALAREIDFSDPAPYSRGLFSLNDLLLFDVQPFGDFSTEGAAAEFFQVTAIRSHPLTCALRALANLYLLTGLLVLALFWLVRRRIRRRLVVPVAEIAAAMEENWRPLYPSTAFPWAEAGALRAAYRAEGDRRQQQDNEVTRLTTALHYAETAEENRRRMTSHIAHELKTPLAVIHSYAEGLKEHIAEDKRERYIDVILSETERTDGMVLEMLDLSRLEAGRVKLARDDVSLPALAKAVFEKLEPAARAKDLQIAFVFPDEFTITADEARLGQVIENLASNAVKYTPPGGRVTAEIQRGRQGLTFSLENDSPPLAQESLEQIWEPFYRANAGREEGTGLGLAIAKSIVELHGGRCFARNTAGGVCFGFTLDTGAARG